MKICLSMDDILELVLDGVSRVEPSMDWPHWLPPQMHCRDGKLVARPVYDDDNDFVGVEVSIEDEPNEAK
jgi:hypothetical protein